MRPQDWACVPMPPGHEHDSVLDVRGHSLKLKTAAESAIAHHLCQLHNGTVDAIVKSFDETLTDVRQNFISKENAEAAVGQAISLQEVFTAMAEVRTASALREAADQTYSYTHLKMQLKKAVSQGLITRETLTKIWGLS